MPAEPMNEIESSAELLHKAFALAYFLHASKEAALQVATAALAKLDIAATAQAKRIYYRPAGSVAGRPVKSTGFRTKVSLEELHLLQRLVFIESEPYEKQTEGAPGVIPLSREDMLVRFLKHLAQITIKRNSFYVTLGVGRVLHNYSTAETMRIHDSLIGNPDGMKDDDYFRARKAVLMQEIRNRFGDLLSVHRVAHGEERFESRSPSRQSAALARESLERFAPWNTPCIALTGLFEAGRQSSPDENKVEVNRMHAVLHPDCLRRITAALNLETPNRRLEIPAFFLAGQEKDVGPPSDRRRPPDLSEAELAAVDQYLSNEAARRRTTSAGLLRVFVDGTERARLEPATTPNVHFEIESGAELIEVRRREPDGDVLLAVQLLQEHPIETGTALEGGRKISFSVAPVRRGGETILAVEIACRQSSPAQAFFAALRRVLFEERGLPRLTPALGLAILALTVAGLGLFLMSRPRQAGTPQIASEPLSPPVRIQVSPSPPDILVSARPPEIGPPAPRAREKESHSPAKPQERLARKPSSEPPEPSEPEREAVAEGTRAARPVPAAASLQDVRLVYVEVSGGEPLSQRFRELLIRQLRADPRMKVAETRDEADAVLKVSRDASGAAAAALVNASGQVIWPPGRGRRTHTYQGSPDESAAALVRALLKDLGSAEHRR
jgi:hypothetical protein